MLAYWYFLSCPSLTFSVRHVRAHAMVLGNSSLSESPSNSSNSQPCSCEPLMVDMFGRQRRQAQVQAALLSTRPVPSTSESPKRRVWYQIVCGRMRWSEHAGVFNVARQWVGIKITRELRSCMQALVHDQPCYSVTSQVRAMTWALGIVYPTVVARSLGKVTHRLVHVSSVRSLQTGLVGLPNVGKLSIDLKVDKSTRSQ